MCVTMGPAELWNTIIYMGECLHPQHGYLHVLGYQNRPQSEEGPNAMILHIPSREVLGPDNVIDVSEWPEILEDMEDSTRPPVAMCLGGGGGGEATPVVFESGIYTVVLCARASRIPEALERIEPRKRPPINPDLLHWYEEHLPGYTTAVCCFDNADAYKKAAPLLWWYKPVKEDVLMAPGIDSHTGGAPNLASRVPVDAWVMVGSHRIPTTVGRPIPEQRSRWNTVTQRWESMSWGTESFRPFAPTRLRAKGYGGRQVNGDYLIRTEDIAGDRPTAEVMTRGVMTLS